MIVGHMILELIFFSLGLMIRIVQYVACMTNKAQIVAYKRLMRNILSQ